MDAFEYGYHTKLASITKESIARWRTLQGLWSLARRGGWFGQMPERRWGALRQARRTLGQNPKQFPMHTNPPIQRASKPASPWPAYDGFPGFSQRHIEKKLNGKFVPDSTVPTSSLFGPLHNPKMKF